MSVKDENRISEYVKMLKELTSTSLEIGIFADDKESINEEGANMLMIAYVNEFGFDIKLTDKMRGYLGVMGLNLRKDTSFIKIPERSFLRSGFDVNKEKINKEIEPLLKKVLGLELSVKAFFNYLGEYTVGLLQEYLTDLDDPPNHPFTMERKGSTNPLVDDGHLRKSITYRVVRR